MNKKIAAISLSTLGLSFGASQSALAQSSVSLYGVLDAGVRYSTNAGIDLANTSGKSRLNANSGGKEGSRFGLTGSEDLGGGTKAIFQLESGFNLGTGALNSKNDNKSFSNNTAEQSLFGRQAYVGLESTTLGKLTLGRQFTVGYDVARIFDPSNNINQTGLTYDLSGTIDGINNHRRSDATLKYSFEKNGLNLKGSIKPGNQTGSLSKGSAYGLGASYKFGSTQLASSYSYISHHRHPEDFSKFIKVNGSSHIFNIGFAHKFDATTLKAGYVNSSIPELEVFSNQQNAGRLIPSHRVQSFGLGLTHTLNPRMDIVLATYGEFKGFSERNNWVGAKALLGSTYKVSNRTSVYGYLDYSGTKNGVNPLNSKKSRAGLTLGLVHKF